MNSLSAMLKRNRKLAGLTQEQLAEKLDVSTVAVQNWESGKNQIRPEKLTKLSYLFNIPLETLIHEMLLSEKDDYQRKEKSLDNCLFLCFMLDKRKCKCYSISRC